MKIGAAHLTYCTNIHPAESWPEVRENLEHKVTRVKALISPRDDFGVGLRLSNRAAESLLSGSELPELASFLARSGLYVFTINGFPYGPFHGTPVKESVYRPDWTEPERLAYTERLARILARLLPEGVEGSISTAPGAFRTRATDPAAIARGFLRAAEALERVFDQTGKVIRLAIEPEPACFLETIEETVAFFGEYLGSVRDFVGVCFDTCHAAVEYESPAAACDLLVSAGIRVVKIQLSCGLKVSPDLSLARRFDEPVYLHQVVARAQDGTLSRWPDLPEAIHDAPVGPEFRVHFHVPVFCEELGPFSSTQDLLREVLGLQRTRALSSHLEVETYTWDVLPGDLRSEDVVSAVARELRWVMEVLGR